MNAENLARLDKEVIDDANKQGMGSNVVKLDVGGKKENDRYKNHAFADIRVKMGDKNIREQEDVPSDISENAWDEVPKYEAMKLKFDQIKEKESQILKKKQVMNTLDQQV